jgi:hypothetical protein
VALLPWPTSTLTVPSCDVCVWFVVPGGCVESVVVVAEIAGPVPRNTKRTVAKNPAY